MSLHKPELLLDLDEIYTIPEGSSLRNFFLRGGGGGDERCVYFHNAVAVIFSFISLEDCGAWKHGKH